MTHDLLLLIFSLRASSNFFLAACRLPVSSKPICRLSLTTGSTFGIGALETSYQRNLAWIRRLKKVMFRPNLSSSFSRLRRNGGKSPALRNIGATWISAERFWFSSDSDQQEPHEKPLADPASISEKKDEENNQHGSENVANFFEDGSTEGNDVSVSPLEDQYTQTSVGDQEPSYQKKKYVPFFEEIDAIMAAKGHRTRPRNQNLGSIDYDESRGHRNHYDPTARTRQTAGSSANFESQRDSFDDRQNIANTQRVSSPRSSLASILSNDFSLSDKADNISALPTSSPTTTRPRPSLSDILSRGRNEKKNVVESNSKSDRPSALASILSSTTTPKSSRPTLSSILAKSREEIKSKGEQNRNAISMDQSTKLVPSTTELDLSRPRNSESSESLQQQSPFYQPASTSIFDAFPIPGAAEERSPNAYDKDAYDQYMDVLNDVVSNNKFTKENTKKPLTEEFKAPVLEWLRRDEKTIDCNLPMLENVVGGRIQNFDKEQRHTFRKELASQKDALMAHTGMDCDQIDAACRALIALAGQCAKHARSLPMEIGWRKLKEAGYALDSNSLSACLYASSAFSFASDRYRSTGLRASRSEGKSSIMDILGSTADADEEDIEEDRDGRKDDIKDLPGEIAIFHDLLYDATEKTLSIRVRSLVADGNPEGAEEMIGQMPSSLGDLRHRTYLPVLRLYLDKGNMSSAVRIFKKMRGTSTVYFEPETYVQYISAIAEHGFFSPDSDPIEGADELGYSPAYGPQLFDQIASEMAEDTLEISSASARRLYTAFESGFRGTHMAKNLEEIHPLAPLSPMNEVAGDGELIASRVSVDSKTAVCPRSSTKLRLINLERDEKKELRNGLLELSASTFEEFAQKVARDGNYDKAQTALSDFATWLDTREGDPFTAIVDGANVAFFGQNFAQGKFNYHQIQFVVDALEKMNEKPLVIIPYKYGQSHFFVHGASGERVKQFLNDEEKAILENLQQKGTLYRVPSMWLDDFFWMLASVSDQTRARDGADLDIAPGNADGKFSGARPMIMSNDQMRDHKLELISPRLFRRWYSCHIVNYSFTAFVDGESIDREIGFSPADTFSREIQGNSSPLIGGQGEGGTAWHFPVSDWELNERMCIRIPTS